MEPNIIVKYGNAGYLYTKGEVHAILTKIGDQKAEQELLAPGIMGVATKLDARKAIEEAKDLFVENPDLFKASKQWLPADHWCEPTLEMIRRTVREEVQDIVTDNDTVQICYTQNKSTLSVEEVTAAITPLLRGKIGDDHPTKYLYIEIYDKAVISLVLAKDMFVVG